MRQDKKLEQSIGQEHLAAGKAKQIHLKQKAPKA
jgi:hypothetical protein